MSYTALDCEIDNFISHIQDTAELASLYDMPEFKKSEYYTKLAEEALNLICERNKSEVVFKECDKLTLPFEQIDQKYEEISRTIPIADSKNMPKFKELKKNVELFLNTDLDTYISQLTHGDNDSEMETQTTVNVICPLSKERIRIPLKNKICKHVYDKTSVAEVLQKGQRLRCPIMGCGNRQIITIDQLEHDILFARLLKFRKDF